MASKKIIAVLGATGAQGGGLVRAILADAEGQFAVRALTRDVNSDKAKALAAAGAEVVAADADDEASLRKAFEGAYGAYCVTFFWDHFSPDKEQAQAAAMARAAKAAGVQHVIWSTLEDTRDWVPLADDRMPTLMDEYKVPHFDAKGASNRFFTEQKVPTTFLLTSFYWDNFIGFGMGPTKGPDGVLGITFPMGDKKLPGIAAEDIGKCALGVLRRVRPKRRRPSASPANIQRAPRWPLRSPRRWAKRSATTTCLLRSTGSLGSRALTTSAICFSSSETSTVTSAAHATLKLLDHLILDCRASTPG